MTRRLTSAATFADDLAAFGEWVGPRTGPDKRRQADKEDYVLRRVLAAWKYSERLDFPLDLRHGDPIKVAREPDFVLLWANRSLGVEITEAGEEDYQAWLTSTESQSAQTAHEAVFVPQAPSLDRTADEFLRAIERKVALFKGDRYRAVPACDLAIYDNTAWGGFIHEHDIVSALGRPADLLGSFRQIHFVFGSHVFLDVFGNERQVVPIANLYEIDIAAWAFDQAHKLKAGDFGTIDAANIAEELVSVGNSERRALGSHLRNLMVHLLKWQFQPKRRSASWGSSIALARSEIHQRLTETPSLRGALNEFVAREYPRARKQAAMETRLLLSRLPESCPYELTQLVDSDYLPEG